MTLRRLTAQQLDTLLTRVFAKLLVYPPGNAHTWRFDRLYARLYREHSNRLITT